MSIEDGVIDDEEFRKQLRQIDQMDKLKHSILESIDPDGIYDAFRLPEEVLKFKHLDRGQRHDVFTLKPELWKKEPKQDSLGLPAQKISRLKRFRLQKEAAE